MGAALALVASCAEPGTPSGDETEVGVDAADVAIDTMTDAADVSADSDTGEVDAAADVDASDDAADTTEDANTDDVPDIDECLPGAEGCACVDGLCNADLFCIDDLCTDDCLPGEEACVCADDDFCERGLLCDRDDGLCRLPETCEELGCVPRQLCALASERCLTACEEGYEWSRTRNICVQETGSSCDPGVSGSLAEECRVQRRDCRLVAGVAECGECIEGHFAQAGLCTPGTCDDPGTDPYSRVDDCADIGRACVALDPPIGGATCGGCLDGLLEDDDGTCVPPITCDALDCAASARECDPRDGFAVCTECVDGYVELPATGECASYVECADLNCAAQSRSCEFDVTATCGGCLEGWVEVDGECACEDDGQAYWPDVDEDGFGDPTQLASCGPLPGYVANDGDCDDTTDTIHPDVVDLPDAEFADTNCDGIDGRADALVFVHPDASDATADGSMAAPFASLAAAMTAAEFADADGIALAVGVHAGPLMLEEGIHVWGGYDADAGWQRTAAAESVIRVTAPSASTDGQQVGLWAEGVSTHTRVEQLAIEVGDHAAAGGTVYGGALFGSPGVSFADVQVRVGRGGDGADGANGGPGANGVGGAGGQHGRDGGNGGAGGSHSSCPEAAGGNGGRGGSRNNYGDNGSPNGCGGAGGEDGRPWDNEGRPGEGGCTRTTAGSAGPDGAAAATPGTVAVVGARSWWQPAGGEGGGNGLPGEGGGGGGGGGGPEVLNYRGGGGGGGGSGGCGGGAGSAGAGGGGSFGLWLVDSALTAERVRIAAGDGGDGGAGGVGGVGGAGAAGGGGGGRQGVALSGSGVGGGGGAGSAGGAGGAGGGGAGGTSAGLRCVRSSVTLAADAVVLAGAAGEPAAGAASGSAAPVLGCD